MKEAWRELITRLRTSDLPVYAVVAAVITVVAFAVIPRNGYLASGDVYPLYLMPGNHELERSIELWSNAYSGLGSPHFAPGTMVLALWGQLWLRLGVSGPMIQWMLSLALLLFAGLSVTFFTRTLFPETRLAALAAGLALPLSFYIALTLRDPIAMFAVGYFPFSAAFLMRRLREPTTPLRFAIEIGLVSLGFMVLATAPPIAVYELLWALAWLIGGSWYWRTLPRTWSGLVMGIGAAVAVNAWWAYAAFVTLFANGGSAVQSFADPVSWSWVDQRATILHLLSMRASWSYPRPEYFPWAARYQTGLYRLALYVPAGLALVGLALSPFRRRTWTLFAVIIVSLFVGKGYHAPLGGINAFLYARLPGFWLFRDPQQATNITLYLSIFVLAGVGISQLVTITVRYLERLRVDSQRIAVASRVAGTALILLLLTNGFALISGEFIPATWLNGDAKSVVLPPGYWSDAAGYLDAQPSQSRVLLLPNDDFYQMPYDWGYYGADGVALIFKQPVLVVSTQTINYITGAPALNPQFSYLVDAIKRRSRVSIAPLLSALDVGWIVQRNDIVWTRPQRDILSPETVRVFLAGQPRIERVETFGKLDLYRVTGPHGSLSAYDSLAIWPSASPHNLLEAFARLGGEVPLIESKTAVPHDVVSSRPRLVTAHGESRDSAHYLATFSPGTRVLVLHSSYSTGWQGSAGGTRLEWQHVPIDGFLNGWIVPGKASRFVALDYRPAHLYGLLQALSLASLCLLIAGFAFTSIRAVGADRGVQQRTGSHIGRSMRSIAIAATMISPPGAMGGNTKIALEFARSWAERGCDVCVLTTPDGERTFREYGVSGVRFRIVSQVSIPRSGLLPAHARLWREAQGAHLGDERFDVAYSASDFIPDLVLARRLRDGGRASRWIGCLYLFVPHPAFGYEGHYSRTLFRHLDLRLAAYYPYQRMVILPSVLTADGNMITNDVDAQEFVRCHYPRERLHAVYGVINYDHIAADEIARRYDAVFVGRLHPQKGIDRLLRIWQRVIRARPGLRLAIVGVGDPGYERRLRHQSRALALEDSISWIGFCEGPAKYDVLRSSRVFLHTSVYDNSGMAAAEAMACGVPVVMFDLPPLRVTYPRGALKAPIGDEAAFAQHVVDVLSDDVLRRALGEQGRIEGRMWDSRLRAHEATSFIDKILATQPLSTWHRKATAAPAVGHEQT